MNAKLANKIALASTAVAVGCVVLGLTFQKALEHKPYFVNALLFIVAVAALVSSVSIVKALDYRLRGKKRG